MSPISKRNRELEIDSGKLWSFYRSLVKVFLEMLQKFRYLSTCIFVTLFNFYDGVYVKSVVLFCFYLYSIHNTCSYVMSAIKGESDCAVFYRVWCREHRTGCGCAGYSIVVSGWLLQLAGTTCCNVYRSTYRRSFHWYVRMCAFINCCED